MSNPLIVPVQLDALVINSDNVKQDGNLCWWEFDYLALNDFHSPEPDIGSQAVATAPGVYLHWSLPRALREGVQDEQQPEVSYPKVPNRWLVLRMSGAAGSANRTATSWVIESDCPYSAAINSKHSHIELGSSSQYLVGPEIIKDWQSSPDSFRSAVGATLSATATTPQIANIGIAFPQSTWSERDANSTFLTAMSSGNDAFSTYYSHNVGVFSMHDSLENIDSATLSYMVVGWYSNPSDDILSSGQGSANDYAALLEQLCWTPAKGVTGTSAASVYEGMALGIDWNLGGARPTPDPLQTIAGTQDVNVSIGNSTMDAFSALIGSQLKDKGHPTQVVELLQAFNFNLLQTVNQVNGFALVEEKIRASWFGSEPGGYRWVIVENDSDGSTQTILNANDAKWLAQLNRDQFQLEKAVQKLFSLQWDLVATWYKKELDPDSIQPGLPGAPSTAELIKALDPKNKDGITYQVLLQFQDTGNFMQDVPQANWDKATTAEQAWLDGIVAFAKGRGLDTTKMTLKASPNEPYFEAIDPVVMLSGIEPAHDLNPDKRITVRNGDSLVSSFSAAGKTINAGNLGSVLPTLTNVNQLPACVPEVISEFFLLDPANAAAISKAVGVQDESTVQKVMSAHAPADYVGQLPEFGMQAWSQPWQPLFMDWKLKYTHIDYQDATGKKRHWTFDGSSYRYTPGSTAPVTSSRELAGISRLVPSAQFVFSARLKEYLAKYKNKELSELVSWVEQMDDWKFLSQQLTGFHDRLAMQDPRAFRRPTEHDTVGTNPAYTVDVLAGFPVPPGSPSYEKGVAGDVYGNVNSVPFFPNGPVEHFYGVRSGQAHFEFLRLYDKFGRVLWLIDDTTNSGLYDAATFPLVREQALVTNKADRIDNTIDAVIQLPPRVLQHARLDFDLVDASDQSQRYEHGENLNPIGGWVLPNHLDHSILLYAPEGESLGEFRLYEQVDGSKLGSWSAPVHSTVQTLADVLTKAPLLHAMIMATELAAETGFDAFLDCIDSTLWTVDPLGNRDDQNLSVLIGRPLALVRSELALTLFGPPKRASDWAHTTLDFSNVPEPDFVEFEFGIRLGDEATRHDGVIGYFADTNYGTFNSVVAPSTAKAQSYIKQIGPIGSTDNPNFINLPFKSGSSQFVSMLVDPRASVHATTGLLPVKEIDIPAGLVEAALTKMQVGFVMGPIMTDIQQTPSQGGETPAFPEAVTLPTPTEQNGTWSWWERDTKLNGWDGYDLVKPTMSAKFGDLPKALREGVLQLSVDMGTGKGGKLGDVGGDGVIDDPGSGGVDGDGY